MLVNYLREREYLLAVRKLFQELDRREEVKAEMERYNFGKDKIAEALRHFESGKKAFNFLMKRYKTANVEREKYHSLLEKAVERVEFHLELSRSALTDTEKFSSISFLEKPRFFCTTDEWIEMAKDQVGLFMTNRMAVAALKKFMVPMSELEEDMEILVKLEESRAFYIKELKCEYEAEEDLQMALNAMSPLVRAAEAIIRATLKADKKYIFKEKNGKDKEETKDEVLTALGIPFFENLTSNSYRPLPLDGMVKDSSIT
jgi:hypothetical protein